MVETEVMEEMAEKVGSGITQEAVVTEGVVVLERTVELEGRVENSF